MANTEFLEKWNSIIPYLIHEYDLTRPTEVFLRNALINYIEMLHIDSSKIALDTLEGSIKLCHYIDHIYKISDDTNSFCFIDLCHPLPKKTAHMLKNILNYLLYFNMLKYDIIFESLQKIEALDAIQLKKNQLEIKLETDKIKAETMERKMNEYEILQPKLEKSIKKLQANCVKLTQEHDNLEENLKILDYKILQLEDEKEKLQSEIVQETEADNLLLQHEKILQCIDEQKEIEQSSRDNNAKFTNLNIELDTIIKKIEGILESFNNTVLSSASKKKEFLNLKEKLEISKKNCLEKETYLNHLEQLYNTKEMKLMSEKDVGQKEINQLMEKNYEIKTLITEQDKIYAEKQNKITGSEEILSKLIEEREMIISKTKEAFEILLCTSIQGN